jgi:hypothetical protein
MQVLDPRLIFERVRTRHPVTLNDVNVGAVKVSGLVEPKLVGQRHDVGNQRISFPAVTGITHPKIGAIEVWPGIRLKNAEGVVLLVNNGKISRTLRIAMGSEDTSRGEHQPDST